MKQKFRYENLEPNISIWEYGWMRNLALKHIFNIINQRLKVYPQKAPKRIYQKLPIPKRFWDIFEPKILENIIF